ncbi:MAG: hypothetical protein RL274_350 [Pseudomonadota bacterium]|jgi:hypothetical protein
MTGIAKAVLAAAWLACGSWTARAAEAENGGQWLKDGDCQLFNADAKAGDTVRWTGACVEGYASGLASFTHDGKTQSFTASFARGMILDGIVVAQWGEGWSYEGGIVEGRFHGAGVLTTDTNDRFEGQWTGGKMNGFGILRRANGERYAGDWKDDKPNGAGELRHPDGTLVAGTFVESKLTQASDKPSGKAETLAANPPANAPFGAVSGKTLGGVDGSSIALNLIEGGLELQVMPADGNARKTTFTFMTDRMGTVVEDSGVSGAGTSVTGFFRLTANGVEVRYADGRSAMLSANDDGVQMALEGEAGASCRSSYPPDHVFSEADKKAALNAYANRLGLPGVAGETGGGCLSAVAPVAMGSAPPVSAKPEKRSEAKTPARIAKASYRIGDYKGLEAVAVRTAPVRTVDGDAAPSVRETVAAIAPQESKKSPDKDAASPCLKVDSDGSHWGFRNDCDFAVQFAYCMAGSEGLAACEKSAVVGSVAAHGFGALSADNSLKETDANHSFRWIACGGGAGEVVARLDRFEPPAGRCERTRTASAN